jgi:uncharacterized cupin superfamily protein
MEVHPGLFVSTTAAGDWTKDSASGAETQVIVSEPGAFVGMSRYVDAQDPGTWTTTVRETVLVLEGRASIAIADGPTIALGPGDVASFPSGMRMTWTLERPFRELWFVAEPY